MSSVHVTFVQVADLAQGLALLLDRAHLFQRRLSDSAVASTASIAAWRAASAAARASSAPPPASSAAARASSAVSRSSSRAARASSARRRKRSVSSREDSLTANRASKASRSSSADRQPRNPRRGTGGLEGFESHAESVGGTLSSAVLECARLSCPKTHRPVKTVPILSRHLGSAEIANRPTVLGRHACSPVKALDVIGGRSFGEARAT